MNKKINNLDKFFKVRSFVDKVVRNIQKKSQSQSFRAERTRQNYLDRQNDWDFKLVLSEKEKQFQQAKSEFDKLFSGKSFDEINEKNVFYLRVTNFLLVI